MSNLYSVLLARFHFFPAVKTHGMSAIPRLALFTSAHVHDLIIVTSTLSRRAVTVLLTQ